MSTIILHKGRPLDNRLFDSIQKAKNYLVFKQPKRQWKKSDTEFICARHGSKFEFIELTNNITL